jgi:RNA polymerase sigma-70 factor (ECF subfamily)
MTHPNHNKHKKIFDLAYHDYEKILITHAFYKVSNLSLSEDLVQNTFIKIWTYLLKNGKIDSMKSFLYHILNALIIDEYRKGKNKTISLDALLEKGYEPSTNSSEKNFNKIDITKAQILILRLPRKYQKIMYMRYIQDLSLKEISQITKQSLNTTTVQAFRGLEKLKILYKL